MTFPDGSRATIGGGINDAPPYDGPDGDKPVHFVWHMNVAPDSRAEPQSLQGKTVDLTIKFGLSSGLECGNRPL